MIGAFLWLSKTYPDIARHGTCSFQWYGRKLWQKSFWLSYFRFLVPIWLVWLFRSNLKPWHWVLESSTIPTLCDDLFFQQTWKVCALIGCVKFLFRGWSWWRKQLWLQGWLELRGTKLLKKFVLAPYDVLPAINHLDLSCCYVLEFALIQVLLPHQLLPENRVILWLNMTIIHHLHMANVSRCGTARTLPQVGEPPFCTL